MKNHPGLLLILSSALISAAFAQEVPTPKRLTPTPTPLAAIPSTPTPVDPSSHGVIPLPSSTPSRAYRANTLSSFKKPEKGRNPFWPIGYIPRAKTAGSDEQLLRIPIEQYKVTSIILDTPSIAVINGKDYIRGQFLTMTTTAGTAKLLITNIEDGFVTVQYKSLVGKIPISRK